jgi:glycine cleavage system T protein
MKDQAEIVIIGGGIYGVNIAYHLSKLGKKDIVLLEKGEIASGESSHAAGVVTQFATSKTMLQFRKYSIELYSELGLFTHVGSLRLASSKEQLKELERSVSKARGIGMDVEIISPAEAVKLMPQLSDKELYGAIYLPRDGHLDPYGTTTGMARVIREMGVTVYTDTRVTGLELSPKGEIQKVITTKGSIKTNLVVNAAGLWAPRIAATAGVYLPTTPVDHQHIAVTAVKGHEFPKNTPCLRDPDNLVYMREEQGGMVIGGYEPNPLARWIDGVPWEHGNATVPADFDRFEMLLEGAIRRIPFLEQAGIINITAHPGAYTPDCQPMLGPVAGARGLWMAAGMSLNGYGGAGGMGKLMAEWIVEGEPSQDVNIYRATRFQGDYYSNPEYAAERTREGVKYYYALRFPNDENEWARPHRVSPVHYRLQELGAVFGEKFGWERVLYFDKNKGWRRAGADQRHWGWTKPPYFDRVAEEHCATRERVALFDLTSFGKIEVSGPDALKLLQRVADSNMDKPIGSATYTQWLNTRGGVEADITVTRIAEDKFWVVTGSGFIGNDMSWLKIKMELDEDVTFRDITQEYACLALWGPRSRDVLSKITHADVSNEGFPYLTARIIDINGAQVRAQRVSYVGELGWELYVPNLRALMVWDMLFEAGREFDMEVGGYKVADSLRLEKGYRYYTTDVTPLETPYEAGLGFCVHLDKGDFIGREALVEAKKNGITSRLCTFVLDQEEFTQIYGGEAVYQDGKVISRVRSGGYGYTVRKNIFYAYLPVEIAKTGTRVEVELIEGRYQAEVTAMVLYDPKGEKLKA